MFWRKKKQDEAYGLVTYEGAPKFSWRKVAHDYRAALEDIAAQETEGANATVKRMARIAREALEN